MQDSRIPSKDGYMIINTDFTGRPGIHWVSGIKQGKNLYIYDSFGRKSSTLLPNLFQRMKDKGYHIHDADTTDQDQYGTKSVDCGHRSISALKICNDYGIKAFMSL